MSEINVKRIFFETNSHLPSFELENGSVKTPYIKQGPAGILTAWLTKEEFVELQVKERETDKNFWKFLRLK